MITTEVPAMTSFRPVFLAMLLFPLSLCAQDPPPQASPMHPLLTAKYSLAGGVFFPEKEFKIRVYGQLPGDEIDFGEAFKLSEDDSTGALDLRWRFGEKWSLFSQYWQLSDSAKATLQEDIRWEDVVFGEGTFAEATTDLKLARIFFGREFSSSSRHEFGLGAGLHWLEIGAGIKGQILTDLGDTELYSDSVEADAPLPNIGAWYIYALSPDWALNLRADWLSASIGDYSGGLTNIGAGIDWSFSKHFGIAASYLFFRLDVDVSKSDWRGGTELTQRGPYLRLRASW
jgi:hypothetical protein